MAIVALHLTQRLTGLMVNKGLITHQELKMVYDGLAAQLASDPSGSAALEYLRAATPNALHE